MNISQQLFEAQDICFGPIDHEKDPPVEARWTHDSFYMRMVSLDPARPMSAAQIKKRYEKMEKEADEGHRLFHFAIRLRSDDGLIGFTRLPWVDWSNGTAGILIGIGSAEHRGKGYGTQALGLLLRFAFSELNLYRLTAIVPEYNEPALRLFTKAGFVREVCRREAAFRDGRRWDLYHLGLLADDWRRSQNP